jgi:hypothetical protein
MVWIVVCSLDRSVLMNDFLDAEVLLGKSEQLTL